MSAHVYKILPGMNATRVLAEVARDVAAVDHEDRKYHIPPGRAAFQRALLLRKKSFVDNSQYLLSLTLQEKASREANRAGRRKYRKPFDPFHPFIIPSYARQNGEAEAPAAAQETAAAAAAAAPKADKGKSGAKAAKGDKKKEAAKPKEELDEE